MCVLPKQHNRELGMSQTTTVLNVILWTHCQGSRKERKATRKRERSTMKIFVRPCGISARMKPVPVRPRDKSARTHTRTHTRTHKHTKLIQNTYANIEDKKRQKLRTIFYYGLQQSANIS